MSLALIGKRKRQKRREKLFGDGRPRPMDRNAKARVMVYARALMRRTEPGKAYGAITAKALAVLEALLWSSTLPRAAGSARGGGPGLRAPRPFLPLRAAA